MCSAWCSAGGAAATLGRTETAGVDLMGASAGEGTVPELSIVGVEGYFRRAAAPLALATLDDEEPIVKDNIWVSVRNFFQREHHEAMTSRIWESPLSQGCGVIGPTANGSLQLKHSMLPKVNVKMTLAVTTVWAESAS